MRVREFFKDFNQCFASLFSVEMRDIKSNTEAHYGVVQLMQHDLHIDWKNAKIYSWSVDDKVFVLTVEKED